MEGPIGAWTIRSVLAMSNQRPAADRIRPILAAMERSIDAARRRRTSPDEENIERLTPPKPDDQTLVRASKDDTAAVIGRDERTDVGESHEENPMPGRLKARPKRPSSTFFTNDEGLQTRAG